MERMYQTTARWTFTLNFPLFLIILMFPGQILSIFGSSYVDGTTALIILAWADLAKTGTGICGAVLDMTGRTRLKLVNAVIMSALMVGLNVLFIPRWGVIGAAIATLTAVAADNLLRLIEVYILFRLLPYNLSFLKPITAGLVAVGTALLLGRLLPAEASLVYTAVGAIVLLVVYTGVILLLGLSEEDRTVLARLRVRVMALFPRS
jgi:O-antigen/teichoic acid export membrane protein